MRGVNLNLFDFDYDLTWMAFFINADEEIYGRYGGRDAESADSRTSLAGLRHAMTAALKTHRSRVRANSKIPESKPFTVDDYKTAGKWQGNRCIHCHQVYDIRRESFQWENKWSLDEVWVYPLPENIGLTLDVDNGNRVRKVDKNLPAGLIGLQPGDALKSVDGHPVVSFADVQYALHRAPAKGVISISWNHEGQRITKNLLLAPDWRKTDISWRWSLRGLEPVPWVDGDDLTPEMKTHLGLSEKRLALRQTAFVSEPARHAGIHPGDVITGVDSRVLEMTARQFSAYIRLNYKVGDRITYNIIRDGKRMDVPLVLSRRPGS